MSVICSAALPGATVFDFERTRALPTHLMGMAAFDSMNAVVASPSKPAPGGATPTVTVVYVRREAAEYAGDAAKQVRLRPRPDR